MRGSRLGVVPVSGYTWAFRARLAPGSPTNLTGRAWAEILKLAKKNWPEPDPKCCFKLFYTIKCAGGLPKPGPKIKARPSGMVMGRIFSAEITEIFFGPARTRPEKCSPLPVAYRRRPQRRIKDVRPELKPTAWLRAQAPRAARSSTPAASHLRPPESPPPPRRRPKLRWLEVSIRGCPFLSRRGRQPELPRSGFSPLDLHCRLGWSNASCGSGAVALQQKLELMRLRREGRCPKGREECEREEVRRRKLG
jgi:hypothetical protein